MISTMNHAFGIGTFAENGEAFPAMVVGDKAIDIRPLLPGIATTADLFADWDTNLDVLEKHVNDPGQSLDALLPLVPIHPAGVILAAGVNYREHIIEMSVAHKLGKAGASDDELRRDAATELDERLATGDPYMWTGIPAAMCGANDDILLPDFGTDVDWEAELGVVIGAEAHRVSEEAALDYVAGYVIVNDVTARSLVPRDDIAKIGTDWFRAKNQPTFFPIGPMVVPSRFIPYPGNLTIKLWLNGQLMQDSTTSNMAFTVPALIAYASSITKLQPGDVIITGSPAGNGSHWKRFLAGGDVITVSIEHLGEQRNLVRAPSGVPDPWHASRKKPRFP